MVVCLFEYFYVDSTSQNIYVNCYTFNTLIVVLIILQVFIILIILLKMWCYFSHVSK